MLGTSPKEDSQLFIVVRNIWFRYMLILAWICKRPIFFLQLFSIVYVVACKALQYVLLLIWTPPLGDFNCYWTVNCRKKEGYLSGDCSSNQKVPSSGVYWSMRFPHLMVAMYCSQQCDGHTNQRELYYPVLVAVRATLWSNFTIFLSTNMEGAS